MPLNKTPPIDWAKLIIGALFFSFLIYVHVYVKELPLLLLASPFALMGVDASKFLGGKK